MNQATKALALGITRAELKQYAQRVVSIAGFVVAFTPTNKDNQVVALLDALINDDADFAKICDLLGIPEDPAVINLP